MSIDTTTIPPVARAALLTMAGSGSPRKVVADAPGAGEVHWRTADWLEAAGYARRLDGRPNLMAITERGMARATGERLHDEAVADLAGGTASQ